MPADLCYCLLPPVSSSDEEGRPHFVLGPAVFLVRPQQGPAHPHWNHSPWSYQVPSGSPQRQGSAIGFCKRERAIVWILVELRAWESLRLLMVSAQSRAPGSPPWCSAEEVAELLSQPRSAALPSCPSSYGHDNPWVCWWPRVSIPWSPFLTLPLPPQEGFLISIYSFFLLPFWCDYLSSGVGGGEENN